MNALPHTMRPLVVGLLTLLSGATLSVCVPGVAVAEKPPQEWDGLQRRTSKTLENVYVRPNVEFKAYKRVRLDPVQVAMDKSWDPNEGRVGLQGRLSSEDILRIRGELSQAFRDVFAEHLSKSAYPLVATNGEDVLLVQAALINVYINAPDTMMDSGGTARSFAMDAGRMTLVMQLVDSVTGQILARVVDTRQGPATGSLKWSNSVTNSAEVRRVIGQWADALCKALDEVNGRAAGK
jgi:hypothetical protein